MDGKQVKDGGKEGIKQDNDKEKDMVDLLLEADGGSFSMEQKVDFVLNLLSAGYDTTSLTMTLAVKFLTEAPTALAQLRVYEFQTINSSNFLWTLKNVYQIIVPYPSW